MMHRYFHSVTFQRIVYAIILALWIAANVFYSKVEVKETEPSFGIVYLWVFLFPATIFMIQILFNSYLGWFISLLIYIAFVNYVSYSVFADIYFQGLEGKLYSNFDYFILGFTVIILIALGYILYKIKPLKSIF